VGENSQESTYHHHSFQQKVKDPKLNLKNCSITEEAMSMFARNGDGSFQGVVVLNLDRNIIANQGGTAFV